MTIKLSSISYAEYMKDSLQQLSSKFSIRSYKTAKGEDWWAFEKGRDTIIKIFWEKTPVYEFIIEKTFWNQRNTDSKDREYMRLHADQKIEMFRKCISRKKSNGV